MGMRTRVLCIAGGAVLPIAAIYATAALGSETTTYSYDALGRLVTTTRSGGPSSGVTMASCFDRAGNRLRYDTLTTTPAACPVPTPTPTPS
jgi:YD repeat-containing protein